ncbi:SMP-30/gluconolactonase/LRE family protein [Alisedimentitalea sp. MJ-SS2]|uniref:SMP-30/gluconolactonase/LRE family protein n=1 Tax=Aliisedimentitalea sp. MJ-SS2 TaxID=3049795 RepID=UPI00290644A8|nr:SMP-30/gluconolactonase/LRE family protein [Alisedimentitalea sp. MJ-SS2]MDU8927045.1 SMP-30/gluconolactonase/LRE family protein [Alisedimentitalea sp. MJ-SS2]
MAMVGDSYEYYDKRFYDLTVPIADVEELYGGCRWAEGPVWFNEHSTLVWSDIPNQRLLRWTEGVGVSVFRDRSNFANGNTRDRQGRLVSCEHGGRRVSRTEPDGSITVIADSYDGKRLNSPNDVVVKSDGTVWFTDPNYGIMSDYEGYKSDMEQEGCYVFCANPDTGELKIVANDFVKPNGLCFNADESRLYIADSGRSHDPDGPHHIRVFDVNADGTLSNGRVFCDVDPGVPDGFRLDIHENVWTSCQDGVICFEKSGTALGKIRIPTMVSNLTFGGPRRNRLFITATHAVYAVYVATTGIQMP